MADLNYKIIGNLSNVSMPSGMKLWCAYLLIDQHPEEHREGAFGDVRQVRGYTWSGASVFTVWISHGDELELGDCSSNLKLLSHDGTMKDIGPTAVLKIGGFQCALAKSDPDQDFFVEDYPCETSDWEPILDKLERFYKAPGIPIMIHVPLTERRSILRRAVPR